MISDPKVIVTVDETDPVQNDQDTEAESEEEHVADVPGAGGEHIETNLVVNFLGCAKTRRRKRRRRRSLRRKRSSRQIPLALGSPRFSQMAYIPKARYSHTKTSQLSFLHGGLIY